jgi:hypothetical protein
MEILIELTEPPTERLSGTVRRVGSGAVLTFDGVMELLGTLDTLRQSDTLAAPPGATDG